MQTLSFDPQQHAALAAQVARPAERMRQYFDRLGLTLVPQRQRVQGRSFDRTRTQAVVLRGDPRMFDFAPQRGADGLVPGRGGGLFWFDEP